MGNDVSRLQERLDYLRALPPTRVIDLDSSKLPDEVKQIVDLVGGDDKRVTVAELCNSIDLLVQAAGDDRQLTNEEFQAKFGQQALKKPADAAMTALLGLTFASGKPEHASATDIAAANLLIKAKNEVGSAPRQVDAILDRFDAHLRAFNQVPSSHGDYENEIYVGYYNLYVALSQNKVPGVGLREREHLMKAVRERMADEAVLDILCIASGNPALAFEKPEAIRKALISATPRTDLQHVAEMIKRRLQQYGLSAQEAIYALNRVGGTVTDRFAVVGDALTNDARGKGVKLSAAVPTVRGDIATIKKGDTLVQIDLHGGRLTQLSVKGKNALIGTDVHERNFGSTFWPSPQKGTSGWQWPPPQAIDQAPYKCWVEGDKIIMVGPVDPKTGISVQKTFFIDEQGWLATSYKMTNHSNEAKELAPWELTRVPREGASAFFQLGEGGVYKHKIDERWSSSRLPIDQTEGIVWYDAAKDTNHAWPEGPFGAPFKKVYADAKGGWLGYMTPKGELLVTCFPELNEAENARKNKGEASEVAVFSDGAGGDAKKSYIELEAEGKLRRIAPGESVEWTTQRKVITPPKELPAPSTPEGKKALVQYVDGIAQERNSR